ncbi:MAG: tetratricopeptide (TPR) repeat protein [Hyphomicrobiaceae bacterium]
MPKHHHTRELRTSRSFAGCFAIIGLAWVALLGPCVALASERSEREASLGLVDFHAARYHDALARFERAATDDSADAMAQFLVGSALARMNRWEDAIAAFSAAAQIDPTMNQADLEIGNAYYRVSRYKAALAPLQRAATKDETRTRAQLLRGRVLLALGRNEDARQDFERVLASGPDHVASGHFYLGILDLHQQHASAIEHFRAVQTLAPGTVLASQAESYVDALTTEPPSPWTMHGALGLEYDSNPGLIAITGLAQSTPQLVVSGDFRTVLDLGTDYRLLEKGRVTVDAGYGFFQTIHLDLNENDLQNHRISLIAAVDEGELQYGLASFYDFYLRDNDSLLHQGSIRPWAAFARSGLGRTEVYYEGRLRGYAQDQFEQLEGANHALGIGWSFLPFGPRLAVILGYRWDREDVGNGSDRPFAYQGHQGEFRVRALLDARTLVEAGLQYRDENYDDPSQNREDTEHAFDLSVTRQIRNSIWVVAAYRAELNDSTESQFEYDRHITTLALEIRK